MHRALIIFVLVVSFKDYKLCNAAILPEEQPLAAFEERDEETIIDITPPPSVVTKGSVSLTKLVNNKRELEYLSKNEMIRRAVYGAKQLGCQPSVLLIQDALESNWGESNLVKKTKNSGNVKCRCNGNKKLRTQHIRSEAKGDTVCVVGYDRIEKSYDRYIKFKTKYDGWAKKINTLSKYKVVKNAKTGLTAEQWCMVLCRSPYATDRQYGKKLINALRRTDFKNIDTAVRKGLSITSESGKYIFYEGGDEMSTEARNFASFPDEDGFYQSESDRKINRAKWNEFVRKNKLKVKRAQEKYKVPASYLLAEKLITSNCGEVSQEDFMRRAKEVKSKGTYIDYANRTLISNKIIHVIEDLELYDYDRRN